MAACDVGIILDDEGRGYVAGEPVRGRVVVVSDDDLDCRGVRLDWHWVTSGRGNTDKGGQDTASLATDVRFRGGEPAEFPFEFTPSAPPVTYHGTHLTIEHAVQARVEVAWRRDPRATRTIEVRPGPVRFSRTAVPATGTRRTSAWPPWAYGGLLVAAGLLWALVSPVLVIVLGVIGVVLGRNRIAAVRLGEVRVEVGATRVVPGQAIEIAVTCQPESREVQLNGVTAAIEAHERCTSGGGKNKRTYHHEIVRHTADIVGPQVMTPNRPVRFVGTIDVPVDRGFTFKAQSNRITWHLMIRIDIAGWPDWVSKHDLEVVPGIRADLPPLPEKRRIPSDSRGAPRESPAPIPAGSSADPRPSDPDAAGAPEPPPVPAPPVPSPAVPVPAGDLAPAEPEAPVPEAPPPDDPLAVLAAIAATDRYSAERDQEIAAARGRLLDLEIEVERTQWAMDFDLPDAYRDGRYVMGKLSGRDTRVKLRVGKDHNSAVDALRPRDVITVRAEIAGWDSLYDVAVLNVEAGGDGQMGGWADGQMR